MKPTLDAIVQVTLANRPRSLEYATTHELRKLFQRYNQLADTFHATDPTTCVDVFPMLDKINRELATRKKL